MSRKTLTRIAAASASAALIATGMSVAVGTGVASAAEAGSCEVTGVSNLSMGTTNRELTVTQTVLTSEVPAGGTLKIRTKVAGDGAVAGVKRLRDNLPAGYEFVSATVNGDDVTSRVKADSAVSTAYVDANSDVEWLTTRANPVVFETAYSVPADAEVGTTHTVGYGLSVALSGDNSWNYASSGACFTIRSKNALEQVSGSLGSAGSSTQILGSLSDPQGSISGILSDVLGNVLGDMIGS